MRRLRMSSYRRFLGLVGLGRLCAAPGCSKDPEVRAVEITKEVDVLFGQQKWEAGEKKAQEILALSGLSGTSRDQAKLKLDQAKSEQQAKRVKLGMILFATVPLLYGLIFILKLADIL